MATKNYEVGGMMESDSCGKPGKPRCRQKFKSKGKSQETKGGILGTLGAVAAGALGYGAYKKLKKEQNGGATKYQNGGRIQNVNKIIKKRINKDGTPVTLDSIQKDMNKKAFESIKKNGSGLKLSPEQELRKKVKEDIEKRGGMNIKNPKMGSRLTPEQRNNKILKNTKMQKGGSLPPMQEPTLGKNLPKMLTPYEERTPKEKRQDKRQLKSALKYYKKHGSGYIHPSEGSKATYKTGWCSKS